MKAKVGLTFKDEQKAQPYIRALEAEGLEVVPMAPGTPHTLDGLSGLVLSGGSDVDPAAYGEKPLAETESDRSRDELERPLVRQAIAADLPVLAICRGMQLLNVVRGGSLIQHLENTPLHRVRDREPWRPVHTISVAAGTRLSGIVGPGSMEVNSRHHQAVWKPGQGLVVSARAEDGTIEAMELPGRRFVVAVQWHPEDQAQTDPKNRKLFEAFAEACATGCGRGSAR